jgi:hypothetical protein
MPDTLATLQPQLDALNAARAKGVKSVQYVGNGTSRTVEYKSDIEMNAAVQDLQRRIAALTSGSQRTIKISTSKGLDHEHERF